MKLLIAAYVFFMGIVLQDVHASTACRLKVDIPQDRPCVSRLVSWYPLSDIPRDSMVFAGDNNGPLMRLTSADSSLRQSFSALEWSRVRPSDGITAAFVSSGSFPGVSFEQRFAVDYTAGTITGTVQVIGDSARTFLSTHSVGITVLNCVAFEKRGGNGSAENSETVEIVAIGRNKVDRINGKNRGGEFQRDNALWTGVKNRFWAYMVRPQHGDTVVAYTINGGAGEYCLEVRFGADSVSHTCTVYAGPVEYASLNTCDPQLTRLMFAMLWNWMRWLSLGLLFLLDWLIRIVPSIGAGVLLLSVCVKVLMTPLIFIADRWQKEVNRTTSRLQPVLNNIRRRYTGEDRHRRTLAAYKEQGVSPLYTLKSLFSVLIQIPVFFAAYHMLSENIVLSGVSFLWIDNLAMPDRLFMLPMAIPFFGRYFNLLPFCMTGVTLLTSWLFADRSLSASLRLKQRRNLYIMAGAFFVLFYTFPAGMVLYWTMNNVLALVKTMFDRRNIKAE